MAATTFDLGEDDNPALPLVGVRLDGLGALVVVPAAILSPSDAITYARRIFDAAGRACQQSGLDCAGRC